MKEPANKQIIFRNICLKNHLNVSDSQLKVLERYVELLLEWNQKINLISRKDEENIWNRHILGSIAFLFHFDLKPKSKIIDVGTGGGLPGIPLSILLPQCQFTLIDSIKKKIAAVNSILSQLVLRNVTAFVGRAEELATQKDFSHNYDYVIARAIGSITDLIRWTRPFLKNADDEVPENKFIPLPSSILLLKGGDVTNEIEEAKEKLKPKLIQVHPIIVNGLTSDDFPDKKLIIIKP